MGRNNIHHRVLPCISGAAVTPQMLILCLRKEDVKTVCGGKPVIYLQGRPTIMNSGWLNQLTLKEIMQLGVTPIEMKGQQRLGYEWLRVDNPESMTCILFHGRGG